jgi:hypothetical protein
MTSESATASVAQTTDAVKTDVVQTDVVQTDVVQTDVVQTDVVQTDAAGPTTHTANTATPTAGPRADMARAGIDTRAASETRPDAAATAAAPQHLGEGQNVALMVVGGAALITGLVIGGDGGTLVAIGGAVIGLWGLFNYVK